MRDKVAEMSKTEVAAMCEVTGEKDPAAAYTKMCADGALIEAHASHPRVKAERDRAARLPAKAVES